MDVYSRWDMLIAHIDWFYKKSDLYIIITYIKWYIYKYRLNLVNITADISKLK